MRKLAPVLGIAAWMVHAAPALACSWAGLVPHTTDPNEIAVDDTPPEPPIITGVTVSRSDGPSDEGCGSQQESSCDGFGSIGIELAQGVDARTPPDQLGYRLEHVAGELPSGIDQPGVIRAQSGGWIWLRYSDPGPDDQPEIDVTFRIVAVDLAGNESAESANARARDSGNEGGCILAGRTGGSVASVASLMGLASPHCCCAAGRGEACALQSSDLAGWAVTFVALGRR